MSRATVKSAIVPDMGRRRGQRQGQLSIVHGSWFLRWREYHLAADGTQITLRPGRVLCPVKDPATGKTVTRKEAQRLAWELVLSHLDQTNLRAELLITLEDFVSLRFRPEWVWALKPAGKRHYESMLKYILPTLGRRRLREIDTPTIQALCKAAIEEKHLSVQTARHIKNALSAIFTHAKAVQAFAGENPAKLVRLPEMTRRAVHALAPQQAALVLWVLEGEARERAAALLSMTTSMNVAELAGLRWKYLNLGEQPVTVEGETLPPRALAVRANFYRGAWCSLKQGSRKRNVPLAAAVIEELERWRAASKFTRPEDPVFAASNGSPLHENNTTKRILRPAGEAAGLPFHLSWHVFRHSAATLAELASMPLSDRQALMGHAGGEMTLHYTHSDTDRLRAGVEQMAALVLARPVPPADPAAGPTSGPPRNPAAGPAEVAELERLFQL